MTRDEIEGMKSNAIASCTTIDTMRDFVVRACDALLGDRILPAIHLFGIITQFPIFLSMLL